jgi:hypothetical protein
MRAVRIRTDLIWRRAGALRSWGVASTQLVDATGRTFDVLTTNGADHLARDYAAIAVQANRDLSVLGRVSARYTLSRSWGTVESPVVSDPFDARALAYPEYVDTAWAAPEGDLADDRRHRLVLWGDADVFVSEAHGAVGVSTLHTIESGRPYGLRSWIEVSPSAANPGYAQPPVVVPYYFTARDAFRTKSAARTDVAAHYTRVIPGTVRGQLLVQLHVLNLFDRRRPLHPLAFTTVNTAFTEPGQLQPFNPFVQTPTRDVHWRIDPRAAAAAEHGGMTMPRAYRLSVGVRF